MRGATASLPSPFEHRAAPVPVWCSAGHCGVGLGAGPHSLCLWPPERDLLLQLRHLPPHHLCPHVLRIQQGSGSRELTSPRSRRSSRWPSCRCIHHLRRWGQLSVAAGQLLTILLLPCSTLFTGTIAWFWLFWLRAGCCCCCCCPCWPP